MRLKYLIITGIAIVLVGGFILMNQRSEAKNQTVNLEEQTAISFNEQSGETPQAPNFQLETLDGEPVKLSDYRGKAVLLNFWATWCAPCRHEIPDFIKMTNGKEADTFVILGMTIQSGAKEKVKKFAEQMGMNYPVLYGEGQTMNRIAELYGGIRAIPTTFLIGPEGKIHKRYVGPRSAGIFLADIRSVL